MLQKGKRREEALTLTGEGEARPAVRFSESTFEAQAHKLRNLHKANEDMSRKDEVEERSRGRKRASKDVCVRSGSAGG